MKSCGCKHHFELINLLYEDIQIDFNLVGSYVRHMKKFEESLRKKKCIKNMLENMVIKISCL